MTGAAPRILLVANTDWYLYNFRLALAESLGRAGWEVVLVAPPGDYAARLTQRGFRFVPCDFATESRSLVAELGVLVRLMRLYRRERPTLVHHFTVKPVLYGSLAARAAGVRGVVNAITGLGYVFTGRGLKARLLRPLVWMLYRVVLGGPRSRVVFQNSADRAAFVRMGLVERDHSRVIRGSGVDCDRFEPETPGGRRSRPVRVLFASRLLWDKGVAEVIEAARLLAERKAPVRFLIAGDVYPGNPSSLEPSDLEEMRHLPSIAYLGHVDDMKGLLERADIVILPSYAEGTPRILIEAAAMERPIVATRIPGCEGLVEDGVNGFLVPVRDAGALADAIERLAANERLRGRMGAAGRRIVRSEFAQDVVLRKTFAVYEEMLPPGLAPTEGTPAEDGDALVEALRASGARTIS